MSDEHTWVVETDHATDSQHILSTWTRVPGRAITLCNLVLNDATQVDTLDMNKPSCENCMRLSQAPEEAPE